MRLTPLFKSPDCFQGLVRLLAFADLHANLTALKELERKAEDADIVACLGDFTVFEQNIEPILERIAKLGETVLVIHGNHETAPVVQRLCGRHESLRFLHRKSWRHGDLTFIGWGGGGFAHHDEQFERWTKTLKPDLKGRRAVLLTHQPPYGTKLDALHDHVGCRSFAAFIRRTPELAYALSGHIHETAGREDRLGGCRLLNPGPAGRLIDLGGADE
jgi:Icc-related predicted phosphoesterase